MGNPRAVRAGSIQGGGEMGCFGAGRTLSGLCDGWGDWLGSDQCIYLPRAVWWSGTQRWSHHCWLFLDNPNEPSACGAELPVGFPRARAPWKSVLHHLHVLTHSPVSLYQPQPKLSCLEKHFGWGLIPFQGVRNEMCVEGKLCRQQMLFMCCCFAPGLDPALGSSWALKRKTEVVCFFFPNPVLPHGKIYSCICWVLIVLAPRP